MRQLFGGHRNKVYKTNGFVKVVWKDGFKREKQIREGVLLENFVAVHTDIKSRMLVDKSKPVEEENGELLTYFYYCNGEIRYPWNLAEIASAAKLLSRLHFAINALTPASPRGEHQRINHRLHLDFARGNVLFQSGSSAAIGVIDFETMAVGPVEQELGRTLSFLLVDTPLSLSPYPAGQSLWAAPLALESRMDSFLTNYGLPYRKEDVVKWTKKYLIAEDYGDLNHIRDAVIQWLNKLKYAKPFQRKNRK